MYQWVEIKQPQDFLRLSKFLPDDFRATDVAQHLHDHLSPKIRGVLIEYPYVDKDYRSTYYGFYAKKGRNYESYCCRLHFFGENVSLTAGLKLNCSTGKLGEDYYGFVVVRPTGVNTIGRTVVSTSAVKHFSGTIMVAKYVVHLLGERLTVRGFPFMQQHSDISVCAHAVCWGILRFYSVRFREYAERLLFDITQMASPSNPGGLVPSRGLAVTQASNVFSEAGLFPDIYDRAAMDPALFYRCLAAYVESGFPVFGAMQSKEHAISVIGMGDADRSALKKKSDPQFAWDATQAVNVIDDNLTPYQLVSKAKQPYAYTSIDAFIVPLPEKVYFPAEAVELHLQYLLDGKQKLFDLSYIDSPVVRYFVTTASAFRNYLQTNRSQFPEDLFLSLMTLVLPQFIWMVEIASLVSWKGQTFDNLMILDATASTFEPMPSFFIMDGTKALVLDRAMGTGNKVFDLTANPISKLSEFRSNLHAR